MSSLNFVGRREAHGCRNGAETDVRDVGDDRLERDGPLSRERILRGEVLACEFFVVQQLLKCGTDLLRPCENAERRQIGFPTLPFEEHLSRAHGQGISEI